MVQMRTISMALHPIHNVDIRIKIVWESEHVSFDKAIKLANVLLMKRTSGTIH